MISKRWDVRHQCWSDRELIREVANLRAEGLLHLSEKSYHFVEADGDTNEKSDPVEKKQDVTPQTRVLDELPKLNQPMKNTEIMIFKKCFENYFSVDVGAAEAPKAKRALSEATDLPRTPSVGTVALLEKTMPAWTECGVYSSKHRVDESLDSNIPPNVPEQLVPEFARKLWRTPKDELETEGKTQSAEILDDHIFDFFEQFFENCWKFGKSDADEKEREREGSVRTKARSLQPFVASFGEETSLSGNRAQLRVFFEQPRQPNFWGSRQNPPKSQVFHQNLLRAWFRQFLSWNFGANPDTRKNTLPQLRVRSRFFHKHRRFSSAREVARYLSCVRIDASRAFIHSE